MRAMNYYPAGGGGCLSAVEYLPAGYVLQHGVIFPFPGQL